MTQGLPLHKVCFQYLNIIMSYYLVLEKSCGSQVRRIGLSERFLPVCVYACVYTVLVEEHRGKGEKFFSVLHSHSNSF